MCCQALYVLTQDVWRYSKRWAWKEDKDTTFFHMDFELIGLD
jgi:hypothetical protein